MKISFSETDNRAYFQKIIGKLYKTLPICEDFPETKAVYMDSLILELKGSMETIQDAEYRVAIITVINTLFALSSSEHDQSIYRREIFKCIRIVGHIGSALHEP